MLQFGEPVAQAIAIVPDVTSLKTQLEAGPILELQFVGD